MSDLNKIKTKDELLAELDTAKASYDSAKVWELEAKIKEFKEKWEVHQEKMKKAEAEAAKEKVMKMDELTNLLQDKPENAEKNAEKIIEQAKTRLTKTIEIYTDKIKELNNANDTKKETLNKEIVNIKTELKKEKNNYEKTKEDFFAKSEYKIKNFSEKDLGKASTKRYRFKVREGKLFNSPKITKMKTIRKNITIKKLIKKFNNIGTNEKNGVRFIMWFEKARFMRYTGIWFTSGLGKIAEKFGMDVPPKDFHAFFNAGKKNIFAILDAKTGDELEDGEKEIITALKKRINYYGYTYARERANTRVNPFVEAEKTANEDEKILTPEKKATKTRKLIPPQKNEAIAENEAIAA